MDIKNAIITSASLFIEDHGFLTCWITLDYGGSGQGFGGFDLCSGTKERPLPAEKNYGGHFVRRVLEVVGVDKWEQLKGKAVRVNSDHSKVHSIGNIVKEDWFCPSEDFSQL